MKNSVAYTIVVNANRKAVLFNLVGVVESMLNFYESHGTHVQTDL